MSETDDYWQGDFTLRQEEDPPGAAEPLPVERLGASGITVGGRELAVLLGPVYRVLTEDVDA
ncbi:hypothetical protein C7C46_02565 [Streptomyces tateyamensis]|uniref:Uncharacterized protein n=1 Tax=Streptomyces tateyamensis TaxID=565073 RepID=A0A2V4NVQ2_9ACTN|nr:hypothetical protein [Streptomyces tateyamensis]PYC87935.1 hypothetical protein C7C46_02565 [Streptomyces tateyamensis]